MLLKLKKEKVCVNKIVGQKLESIVVEGDIIVPDIKPDILNTISTSGNVCIYKKEAMEGKIRIDGGINVYIVYLPDSEESTVRSLNTVIDFSKILEFDDCKPGMNIIDNINIKTIECKILNGRKVNVKVILDENIKLYSNEDIEIVNEIEDIKHLEKLEEELCINSLLGFGETTSYAKETMSIDNVDNLAEILKVDVTIVNKENKISYNKVLCKAEALVKIMYLTDDGRIKTIENRIPVMGFIDMPNVNDTNICNTKYKIKNLIVKPNQVEEHSIYVEVELELATYVYEKKDIKVMQDLYSPEASLEFANKQIETRSFVNTVNNVMTFNEKVQLERLNENEIYDVDITPIINETKLGNSKIIYAGELKLIYTYKSDGINKMESKEITIPFEHIVDIDSLSTMSFVETNLEVRDNVIVVMPDGSVETKITLVFEIELYKSEKINLIEEIEMGENANNNPYSMVIYFTKDKDTLWNIGKAFNSKMEDIARLNGLEQDARLTPGMQLFIPKYCKK